MVVEDSTQVGYFYCLFMMLFALLLIKCILSLHASMTILQNISYSFVVENEMTRESLNYENVHLLVNKPLKQTFNLTFNHFVL